MSSNEYMRDYRKENRKDLSFSNRLWRNRNRAQYRNIKKKYYERMKSDPSYRFNNGKQAAKKRGIPFAISKEEYISLIGTSPVCSYCHISLKSKAGFCLDRLDSRFGYEINNVVLCCGECNKIKSNILAPAEMKAAMTAVLNLRGLNQCVC